jgi:hypothetical protein
MSNNKMQEKYLPFDKDVFMEHFAPVGKNIKTNINHLNYYTQSINNYENYKKVINNIFGKHLYEISKACQIQKDERFWTVNTFMNIYYSPNRINELCILFVKAFGKKVPISIEINSWEECLSSDNLKLYFEVDLPSPAFYKKYLYSLYKEDKIQEHQIIPFILASAHEKQTLEGATQVDALILNPDNGFNVLIEAKVLSDISIRITYDVVRNQIARNIDVMLELNERLCAPLNKRDPDKSLFLLVTPKLFKDNPSSRLYGYKIREYKDKNKGVDALKRDLPHRVLGKLKDIPSRIGWLTWENFKEVNNKCSPWLLEKESYL